MTSRIAALADIALQDALVEIEIDGEKVWAYDDDLFLKSLTGNGYTVVPATEVLA